MVLIGLGSNRGDSGNVVVSAMDRLCAFAAGALLRSRLWRTSPVDCPPGSGDFINAAVAFAARPELTPEQLLRELKALEAEYGRDRTPVRNAPRELDLDLLLFDDQTRDDPDFVLPHPRAVNRLFVLAPAAEVAAEVVWPGLEATIGELLDGLESDEQVEVVDAAPA
ncbi:MAG: 2-amino-4-hydroxy-6-hydroxymethyldihydropteridine diphosphokinase [Gammaproteobacteria bacterium]|nr:2-amino-4-hydroxy-6-hydroxymethyldihydropteridine diphosphokinase [Gammaproteobacteria bacterium]